MYNLSTTAVVTWRERGTVGLSVRRASSLSLPGWDGSVRLVNSV